MNRDTARVTSLCLDVDLRIRDIWLIAYEVDDDLQWDLEMVGTLLRAAYGQGYVDALTEEVPAQLHRVHGYRIPERRKRA